MKLSARSVGSACNGTTRTMGLPALAIVNSRPLAACSTSRESCVLASWILTVTVTSLLLWVKADGLSLSIGPPSETVRNTCSGHSTGQSPA